LGADIPDLAQKRPAPMQVVFAELDRLIGVRSRKSDRSLWYCDVFGIYWNTTILVWVADWRELCFVGIS
jgi:hypothetical protein